MDCKEFEKLIPYFQEDTLSNKELQQFMAHIDSCADCQEELAIHYLVNEGIMRLEDGNTFDLQKVMDSHMERARAKLWRRRLLQLVIYGMEAVVIIVIVIILSLITFH